MLDGQFEVPVCEKCGSLDVEIDISTGKLNCKSCKQTELNTKKIDMEKVCDQITEKQQKIMDDFVALGGKIMIKNNPVNNPNQITNKTFYGTEKEY